jgi:hypothetical protein
MRKEYFIERQGQKQGAFSLEELKAMDIYDYMLVWKAGWDNWKKVTEVEELKDVVITSPPPTPKEKELFKRKEQINFTLKQTSEKTVKVVGVIIFAMFLIALMAALSEQDNSYGLGFFAYIIWGIIGIAVYLTVRLIKE